MDEFQFELDDDTRGKKFTKDLANALAKGWDGRFFKDPRALGDEGKIAFGMTPDFVNRALKLCRSKRTRKLLKTLQLALDSMGPDKRLYIDGQGLILMAGSRTKTDR